MRLPKTVPVLVFASLSGLIFAQFKPPNFPPIAFDCKHLLVAAATKGAIASLPLENEVKAVIVTNDASTQTASYLKGSIISEGHFLEYGAMGSMWGVSSNELHCVDGAYDKSCPVPTRPPFYDGSYVLDLWITASGHINITWPDHSVSDYEPTCPGNGTFVFVDKSYTGVLTLVRVKD